VSRSRLTQRFFYWRIFAKSLPEKYDFNLQEGFSMEKMAQIRQISKKVFYQSPDFFY
jgi:hypothetical protein